MEIMFRLRSLVLISVIASPAIATEPRQVAEAAATAWSEKDAPRLQAVAHPELIRRARAARICESYFREQPEKLTRLRTGSAADVIALLCEAMRAIVPDNKPLIRVRDYEKTELRGDLAVVTFQTGWKRPTGGSKPFLTAERIVLQKSGDDWKFLWSDSANLHIDLDWNPLQPHDGAAFPPAK